MPMSEAACQQVVRELFGKYGQSLPRNADKSEMNLGASWKPEIQDLSRAQIERGMTAAMEKYQRPPNAALFAQLCRQHQANSGCTCGNHGCPVPVGVSTDWCTYHQYSPRGMHEQLAERLSDPDVLQRARFVLLLRRMSDVERITGDHVRGGHFVWPWSERFRNFWRAYPPHEWGSDDADRPANAIPIDEHSGVTEPRSAVAWRENPGVYMDRIAEEVRLLVGAEKPRPAQKKTAGGYRQSAGPREAFA